MRHQDWPQRLARFVAAAKSRPFEWGVTDCATFARDWIEECTGDRVFEVPYTDMRSAVEFIAAQGGMLQATTSALGEPREVAAAAQRGDIALMDSGDRKVLGVVLGEWVAAPAESGTLLLPRDKILAAWRV